MFKLSINKIINLYLICSLFILAFVEVESSGSVPLKIFYIENNKGYFLLIVSIIILLLTFIYKSYKKIDLTVIFLLCKCVLDLIPFFRGTDAGRSSYWYYYAMVLMMPIVYFIFKQFSGDCEFIINTLTMFGLLLICQVVATAIHNGYSFTSSIYKNYLRIPIAHSNIIGVILLTILVLRLIYGKKDKKNIIIDIVYVFGLILIQSRGSWIFLIAWFSWVWIKKLHEKKKDVQISLVFLLILFFAVVFVSSETLQELLLSTTLNKSFDIYSMTSGRTKIWSLAVTKWLTNPWFGTGLGVTEYDIGREVIFTGVHNIIIDYAVQSGIVGIAVYAAALIHGLQNKKKKKSSISKSFFWSSIVILLYSMVEVCYYNFPCLFLFWMLMGIYNSKSMEE